jgi:hypothetical protein
MSQKRRTTDQIIAKLRRADVELGKGKTVPDACKVPGISEQTYLPPALEIWRYAAGDGEGTESPSKREYSAEEDGGQAGS